MIEKYINNFHNGKIEVLIVLFPTKLKKKIWFIQYMRGGRLNVYGL